MMWYNIDYMFHGLEAGSVFKSVTFVYSFPCSSLLFHCFLSTASILILRNIAMHTIDDVDTHSVYQVWESPQFWANVHHHIQNNQWCFTLYNKLYRWTGWKTSHFSMSYWYPLNMWLIVIHSLYTYICI